MTEASELPIVRSMAALANDCGDTDGWDSAAPDLREAASLITELVSVLDEVRLSALAWGASPDARSILKADAVLFRALKGTSHG